MHNTPFGHACYRFAVSPCACARPTADNSLSSRARGDGSASLGESGIYFFALSLSQSILHCLLVRGTRGHDLCNSCGTLVSESISGAPRPACAVAQRILTLPSPSHLPTSIRIPPAAGSLKTDMFHRPASPHAAWHPLLHALRSLALDRPGTSPTPWRIWPLAFTPGQHPTDWPE